MPTPSLILVPARFKTGKLYTPVATTSGGLVLGASGDFNVTRATTATRFNSAGLIESVASGVPRLDYYTSGGTAGCPALLVEPSAQNIMAQSENLSNSIEWSPTNVNVTGSAIASPDGLASGTLLIATSGNVQHNINRNATTSITSGTTITASCFFKAHGTNTFIQIAVGGFTFSPASPFANFNLSGNGAITTGTYSSAFIQNYGNGWYRCGLTATAAANGTNNLAIVPIIASGTARNPTFAGDGVNGVYAWGAQVETGSVATSYIPTTTAAVTRNADVINVSGAVSGCIGQTEGTIYAEVDIRTFANVGMIATISDGTASNRVDVYKFTDSKIYFDRISSTQSAATGLGSAVLTAGIFKVAVAYKSGDTTMYINGTQVGTTQTQTFTFSSLTKINIGVNRADTALFFNDRIRSAALYTTRLTNAELAALTQI
jgi:hypothetical protein